MCRRVAARIHDGNGIRVRYHLQDTARGCRNVLEALIEGVKSHSLGQISHALYDVGGEYRRNMYAAFPFSLRVKPPSMAKNSVVVRSAG